MAQTELDSQLSAPRPLSDDHRLLSELYERHGADVLAYALRRASSREDAADALAETFLIAWRRLSDIPPGPQARLWLYGVARHSLLNISRGERRRSNLAERLRAQIATIPASAPAREESGAVLEGLAALAPADRELLMLVCWEGLSPTQAARVLGITAVAARVRLHRARARMRNALGGYAHMPAPAVPNTRQEDRL